MLAGATGMANQRKRKDGRVGGREQREEKRRDGFVSSYRVRFFFFWKGVVLDLDLDLCLAFFFFFSFPFADARRNLFLF